MLNLVIVFKLGRTLLCNRKRINHYGFKFLSRFFKTNNNLTKSMGKEVRGLKLLKLSKKLNSNNKKKKRKISFQTRKIRKLVKVCLRMV